MSTATPPTHLGRKISRIREFKGIKQETLAIELGITQQAVSKLEQSEKIDEDKLLQIAQILGVTVDAIKNFSEESTLNFFNDIHDNDFTESKNSNIGSSSHTNNYDCTFNPLDKLIESQEENRKLYERLLAAEKEILQVEREKTAYLEQLLNNK